MAALGSARYGAIRCAERFHVLSLSVVSVLHRETNVSTECTDALRTVEVRCRVTSSISARTETIHPILCAMQRDCLVSDFPALRSTRQPRTYDRVKFLTFRNETFVPRTGDASIRVNRSCPHKYAPACAERQIIVARQIRRNNAGGSYTADDIAPRNSVVSIVSRYVSYGNDLSVGVRETDVKEDEKPSVEEELYGAVRRLFLYL